MMLALLALAACGENGTTPETGDLQHSGSVTTEIPSETPTDYYTGADGVRIPIVMERLAGVWDWPDSGRIIYVYPDGTGY